MAHVCERTKDEYFRHGGRLRKTDRWFYAGKEVPIVNKFKFLGIWFTPTGSMTRHVETMSSQANKALFLLRRLIRNIPGLPLSLLWHLFDTMISSIVLYGAELYGAVAKPIVDKAEIKFAKLVLGLPTSTANSGVLLELDHTWTAQWKAHERAIRYWVKILQMPEYRYVKMAYRLQRAWQRSGMQCWASSIYDILSSIELETYWEDENPDRDFLKQVRERLQREAYRNQLVEAQSKETVLNYLKYKPLRGQDPALMKLNFHQRRRLILARLDCQTFVRRLKLKNQSVLKCTLCETEIEGNSWVHILRSCEALNEVRRNTIFPQSDDPLTYLFTSINYSAVNSILQVAEKKKKWKDKE